MNARILILGKAGRPGTAKTRLIPELGASAAHAVHLALAEAVVVRALSWSSQVHLALDPLPQQPPAWSQGASLCAQPSGDLGERLAALSERMFAQAGTPLVILGTDAPDLPRDRFEQACAACARGEASICPSRDGGYNLVALPHPIGALWEGIDWGTERVAEQTRAAADRVGVVLHETAGWEDVDTPEDLVRLRSRLADAEEAALMRLQAALNPVRLASLKETDRE